MGLSDHTLGIAVPVAAVALGACIIEKHFTMDRSMPGPDSAFSLEPQEFKDMVEAVRTAEKALDVLQMYCLRLDWHAQMITSLQMIKASFGMKLEKMNVLATAISTEVNLDADAVASAASIIVET